MQMRYLFTTGLLTLPLALLGACDGTGAPEDDGPNGSGGAPGLGGAAGLGGTNGTGSSGSGSGGGGGSCAIPNPSLGVTKVSTTSISALGTPFPTDSEDLGGPRAWSTRYGKAPEIVVVPGEDEVAVLFQNQSEPTRAVVVRLGLTAGAATIEDAYEVESLGRILGFARDPEGAYYVATAVDEDAMVDAVYPPNDVHRSDVVRVVKFDGSGCVLMESDVDLERGEADPESEILVNPLVAATGRLAYGDGQLALVHGHNTEPDAAIGGTRHQKAITTHLSATDGSVTRTSTMWVSHSFDERLYFDGVGFVELHLGDAYPRAVTLGRFTEEAGDGGYRVFAPKGETGANDTYTRLGGIVPSGDSTYGQLALLSTERTTNVGDGLQGTRDLALVRVAANVFEQNDDAVVVETGGEVSTQLVQSGGEEVTNHVRWLTDLGPDRHAERPRIVALGEGQFVVLWERWAVNGDAESYEGTFAMTIDASGAVSSPATLVSNHHLSRGDDAVAVGGRALYVTGTDDGELRLNFVSATLESSTLVVP